MGSIRTGFQEEGGVIDGSGGGSVSDTSRGITATDYTPTPAIVNPFRPLKAKPEPLLRL